MMSAQGGDSDPVLFTIPVNDIAAATVAVLGVCLGLFHRLRTGVGQRIWTSLLGCSAMMQSGELVRFAGRAAAVRGGRDHAGPSALDRYYATGDGWLRLQAPDVQSLQAAGLLQACTTSSTDAELAAMLATCLASMTVQEALTRLNAAGIPCAAARQPADLLGDPSLADLDMFAGQHMQDGTPFYVVNRYARFSRTEECAVFVAPGIGEHSCQVLEEAGVPRADVEALVQAGAVKQGGPFRVVGIQNYR
jgi:crotonobetainyl-CoA:carnitine CoA-transferase CaiB-like acyl-CoA transferase